MKEKKRKFNPVWLWMTLARVSDTNSHNYSLFFYTRDDLHTTDM